MALNTMCANDQEQSTALQYSTNAEDREDKTEKKKVKQVRFAVDPKIYKHASILKNPISKPFIPRYGLTETQQVKRGKTLKLSDKIRKTD